ncbi:MAG: hypothetical protein LAKADJCE_00434 [Candidatus Argoarchaeum ethanivorans]|uniref:Uncharacterized protein n=1 Tax=Candidatus Argoarchaeum ethanivorans TaxID=2608793 RepID=A0A811TBC8_9EURY|nr:MAG: hypothetical protein LAKADJCE_00434 [Candidatus Argoarchaeum ethanivorans]
MEMLILTRFQRVLKVKVEIRKKKTLHISLVLNRVRQN